MTIYKFFNKYDLSKNRYFNFAKRFKQNTTYYMSIYEALKYVNMHLFETPRFCSPAISDVSITLVKDVPILKLRRDIVCKTNLDISRGLIIDLAGHSITFEDNAYINIIDNELTHYKPNICIYGVKPGSKIVSDSQYVIYNKSTDIRRQLIEDLEYTPTSNGIDISNHRKLNNANLDRLLLHSLCGKNYFDSESKRSWVVGSKVSSIGTVNPHQNQLYIIGGEINHQPNRLTVNDSDPDLVKSFDEPCYSIFVEDAYVTLKAVTINQHCGYQINSAVHCYNCHSVNIDDCKIHTLNFHAILNQSCKVSSLHCFDCDFVTLTANSVITQGFTHDTSGVVLLGGREHKLVGNKIKTIMTQYVNSGYGVHISGPYPNNASVGCPNSIFKDNDIEGCSGGIGINTPNKVCKYLSGRSVSWNTGHGGIYVSAASILKATGGMFGVSNIHKYPGASGMSYFSSGCKVYLDNVKFINEDNHGTAIAFTIKQGNPDSAPCEVHCSNCVTNGTKIRVDAPHKLILGKRGIKLGDGTILGS